MATIESPETLGIKPIDDFNEAQDTWPRGDRPAAIREAARDAPIDSQSKWSSQSTDAAIARNSSAVGMRSSMVAMVQDY